MNSERYSRQLRFPPIGEAGQRRLAHASVAVVGCGALGSAVSEQLVRAGVGSVRIIDRDFVELSNLQRQCLFTEADAAANRPKAVAAAEHLHAINNGVSIHAAVAHLDVNNADELLAADVVIDGSDNFPTRHLINEWCCRAGVPWVYGGVVGSEGLSLPIIPGRSPCLRCLQDELPAAGEGPTCDSAGVIAPAVHLVASRQVALGLRLLIEPDAVEPVLVSVDAWRDQYRRFEVVSWRNPHCLVCGDEPQYPSLTASTTNAVVLCGRDAIQLPAGRVVDLPALAQRVGAALARNDYLLRWKEGELTLTAFVDGRFLVQGVADEARALALRDRWLG